MKNASISLNHGLLLRFVFCIASVIAVLIFSSFDTLLKLYHDPQLQPNGYHVSFILQALLSDSVLPFVTIISVLPLAGIYVDEVKSKFVRYIVFRSSYSTYLCSRIGLCYFFGGAVILVGVLASYCLSILVFLPMEKAATNETSQLPELIDQCILLFLNGGFWAVLGMTMSTVMESKYIAYASPFVVYYLLVMLCERYFPKAYLIYPREWLNPSEKWPMGTWGVAIFLLELTTLLGLIFYRRGKRRLEQL